MTSPSEIPPSPVSVEQLTPRDDFRVQTFEMPDGRLTVRLTGNASGVCVQDISARDSLSLFACVVRCWMRAVGHEDHWISRWLNFSEVLRQSVAATPPVRLRGTKSLRST